MSWSVLAAVLAALSSHWRLVAGTVVLAAGLQVLLSWRKKRMSDARLWQVIKDIPDVSTFVKPGTRMTSFNVAPHEHQCYPLSRRKIPGGYLINATSPEYAKCILAGVDKKTSYAWRLLRSYVGDGVLSSQGAKWFRSRKMLTPAFHFGVLKEYFPLFQKSIEPYLDKWAETARHGSSIEVSEDIELMTLKALLKCAFGDFPMSEEEQLDYQRCLKTIVSHVMDRLDSYLLRFDFIYSLTNRGRTYFDAIKRTKELARGVIREKRKNLKNVVSKDRKYKDFLDIITEAKDEDGNLLDEDSLIDEVQTFFFAGHDTTSSAIPFILYNLARHPEYQEKCRNEIDEVCAGHSTFTGELISKLQFMNMCIKESLRMHPPVWGISRRAAQPITLPDGRVLPQDCDIGVAIYAIMHNPEIWKDPNVFDPYRFHPSNADTHRPYEFIAFSAGSRNCIGMNFALSEIRVSVAAILRRFRVSLDPEKPLKMCQKLLLKTEDGLWLKMEQI